MHVHGATALVTGAAGGLGGAIARALHAGGARLILTGRRASALEALAAEVNGAEIIVCDLADRRQLTTLIDRVTGIDIVVANAALAAAGRIEDFTTEELDRALEVNLRTPILMTRQLLPDMVRRRRGHFVYIASIAGKIPTARLPVYSATKYGLRGFSASLRQDLHGTGVSASVIFPASVTDAGMLADAHLGPAPGSKGTSAAAVGRAVVTAIDNDRAEIDVADTSVRIAAKLAGLAPGLMARLTQRKDAITYAEQLSHGLRHLR
ncbi:SDR family NAD(P)-dependent oxidoreductase [Nocardia cyriacigeorgica]|uniref:SDR family NAD(P)-dependent oxidoreductase n=1 Tax=Nocardia cyriacigeorgica TaxID=135487 RepID=UPI002455F528|nr:SDR family NAD(P)-dependent oxidoreductase [Nocardia cyriacigeorgica]